MEKRKFNIFESINSLIAAFFFSYILQLFLLVFCFSAEDETFLWLAFFINAACFFFAVLGTALKKKIDFKYATRLNFKFDYRSIPVLLLISVCTILTSLLFATGLSWFFEFIGCDVSVQIPQIDTWQQILLSVIIIVFFAPLAEEIMFRGAVFGSLKKRGAVKALLISALIFSLMHISPAQTIHQFILGIVLAFLVLISDSLIPAIIVHLFNNLLVVVLPLIFPALSSFEFSLNLLGIFVGLSLLGIVGLFLLLPLFSLLHRKEKHISVKDYKDALMIIFKKGKLKEYINSIAIVNTTLENNDTLETVKKENLKIYFIITVFVVLWLISFIGGFYV